MPFPRHGVPLSATYGIEGLRHIQLQGEAPDPVADILVAAGGATLAVVVLTSASRNLAIA